MLLALSLMLMNQQRILNKASLNKHIKVGCILISRWNMIRGSQVPNPAFPLGAVVQNSPIHCCQQLYWTQWPQKNENQQYLLSTPRCEIGPFFLYSSLSINCHLPAQHTHTHTGTHVGTHAALSSRRSHVCMHTDIQASPQSSLHHF